MKIMFRYKFGGISGLDIRFYKKKYRKPIYIPLIQSFGQLYFVEWFNFVFSARICYWYGGKKRTIKPGSIQNRKKVTDKSTD